MSDDPQHDADVEAVSAVLREYQHGEGHATIEVTVRNGKVQLIEDTRKRKPRRVDGASGG